MSECVVRMEMPRNCYNCDLRYECNAFYAPGKPKPFMKGCQIICQLPEGHGRLVDFNDVSKQLHKYGYVVKDEATGMQYMEYPIVLEQNPIRIPTIVPAEAERSET